MKSTLLSCKEMNAYEFLFLECGCIYIYVFKLRVCFLGGHIHVYENLVYTCARPQRMTRRVGDYPVKKKKEKVYRAAVLSASQFNHPRLLEQRG